MASPEGKLYRYHERTLSDKKPLADKAPSAEKELQRLKSASAAKIPQLQKTATSKPPSIKPPSIKRAVKASRLSRAEPTRAVTVSGQG